VKAVKYFLKKIYEIRVYPIISTLAHFRFYYGINPSHANVSEDGVGTGNGTAIAVVMW